MPWDQRKLGPCYMKFCYIHVIYIYIYIIYWFVNIVIKALYHGCFCPYWGDEIDVEYFNTDMSGLLIS
jgi:hypothetical protein